MKAKKLADYLLEYPDRDVQFLFTQWPDEISELYDRRFDIVDARDRVEHKTVVLVGDEISS